MNLQHKIWIISMIAAPTLISIAQFYWQDGLLTVTAGWIQILGFTFWITAFHGMFQVLKEDIPNYAALGFFISIYACIGGAGFGYDGLYTNAFGYTSHAEIDAFSNKIGIPLVPALFLPGLLFPLSLLVLGIQLLRRKKVENWLGMLLILAAVFFPLSRMPRIDSLAHLDNGLLILSHVFLVIKLKTNTSN